MNTFIFDSDTLMIVNDKGKLSSTRLNNNGNKNPYKSKNYNDRPTQITAACAYDTNTDIFISNSEVYTFTYSDTTWTKLGAFTTLTSANTATAIIIVNTNICDNYVIAINNPNNNSKHTNYNNTSAYQSQTL